MAASGVLTDNWLNAVLNRAYKDTPNYNAPSHGLIGAGTTTPVSTDSNLKKPLPATATSIDACDATTGWTQAADGDACALNTTAGERKEGTGCLNLPMTFSTGQGSWSKTIASANLTSQYLYVWYYIADKAKLTDATDTVRITLGTGGYTNVNYYDTDYDDLAVGWNLLVFKCSSYSSQGGSGATLSGVDRVRISIRCAATIATNGQRMDYWHYADEDGHKVAITTNYPTFNTGNKTVTSRVTFPSGSFNDGAYPIAEVGMRNDDASWMLVSRDVLGTDVNKTSKVRFVVEFTEEISQ